MCCVVVTEEITRREQRRRYIELLKYRSRRIEVVTVGIIKRDKCQRLAVACRLFASKYIHNLPERSNIKGLRQKFEVFFKRVGRGCIRIIRVVARDGMITQ